MRIGITGISGFLGRHLAEAATAAGHEVVGFSREAKPGGRTLASLDFSGLDALVHLAGENVLGLWTKRKKRAIRDSRVEWTRKISETLATMPNPPRVFLCASGISIHGNRGDELLDENSTAGDGFLAGVVREWEEATAAAQKACRVVNLRISPVLDKSAGPGALLRRVFKLGLGGRLGNGAQWMPWIHRRDAVRLILWAMEKESIRGPLNITAPEPVTNREFTKTLAKALRRPAFFHNPAFLLKCLPGGMAEFFLDSLRAIPRKALEEGFVFDFPDFASAARDLAA